MCVCANCRCTMYLNIRIDPLIIGTVPPCILPTGWPVGHLFISFSTPSFSDGVVPCYVSFPFVIPALPHSTLL
jgi:hypothetical protein